MRPIHRLTAPLAFALALAASAGCSKIDPITAPAFHSGSADFSRYVALGTSLAAGEESGAIVDRHQPFSYAGQFAGQIGVTLTRPSYPAEGLSLDGTTGILHIQSLQPLIVAPAPAGATPDVSDPNDYTNLGVLGAIVTDVIDSSGYYAPARNNPHFGYVVRHRGLIVQAVARLQPTFVSFEYGANELLGPATSGSGAALIPPSTWASYLHLALDAVQAAAPNAKLAIFNVPDPTMTPFASTFPPYTQDTTGAVVSLIGPGGTPLTPAARVLLSAGALLAAGDGFPTSARSYVSGAPGTGNPLPDAVVLTGDEVTSLRTDLYTYNAAIQSEAGVRGAALVDFFTLLNNIAVNGYVYNGVRYSTAYVTGGLFGLDGVHPSDLGYGVIANLMIDAVNAKFGATISRVDLARVSDHRYDRAHPTRTTGYPVIQDGPAYFARLLGGAPPPLP
jgi:lysophospholipase L1-like esterase